MVTIYNIKKADIKGDGKFLVELMGLSTDEKPTSINGGTIENGSIFIEMDTQDIYMYDLENTSWVNPNAEEQSEEQNEEQGEE